MFGSTKRITLTQGIVEEPNQEEALDDEEPVVDEVVNTKEHPQDDVGTSQDRSKWFNQSPRPGTLDPEWSKDPNANVGPEQNWFHELEKTRKDPGQFNDLMGSTIDFSNFIKHHLNKDQITKVDLEGHVFKILKGTCRSSIELEYHLEQCYLFFDQLDWTNPEGDRCPHDLNKSLPLQGHPGRLTIPVEFFFKNDLEYLKNGNKERKYAASVTQTKAASYSTDKEMQLSHEVLSHLQILGVIRLTIDNQFAYGYLKEIVVRRADLKQYSFREADFSIHHLNDIEDLSIVIQRRVEDVQLGVESYQKKLNITKPQTTYEGISCKEPYTIFHKPIGVVYLNKSKQKRLMRADELYTFSNGTLQMVRDNLHDIIF
nr:hypothetical protein [Tanacetum cinerariifolium]